MKAMVVALTLCAMSPFAMAADRCQDTKNCEQMMFTWSSNGGFQVISDDGKHTELEEKACAVRTFCPTADFDGSGNMVVEPSSVVLPKNVSDTPEIRTKLASDCAEVVPSQLSNSCYDAKVWQSGNGGAIYNQ